jgi:hypothetical protein
VSPQCVVFTNGTVTSSGGGGYDGPALPGPGPAYFPRKLTAYRNARLRLRSPGLLATSATWLSGLAVTAVSAATPHGTVVSWGADGSLVYEPAADRTGADTLTYSLRDGQGRTTTVAATINVLGAWVYPREAVPGPLACGGQPHDASLHT